MVRAAQPLGLLLLVVAAAPAIGSVTAPPTLDAALPEVLLSRQVLEARGLAVGDVVQLSADPRGAAARPFRIAARYEPMPDPFRLTAPRHEARLHLPDLLELIADPRDPSAAETVEQINLALVDPATAARVAADLLATAPGLIARPTAVDARDSPFVVMRRFHAAIAVVTVLSSTAFLLALMVIRADERREIAGILRLLGWSRRRVLVLVLAEGACLAAGGAVAGVLLALACQTLFNRFFQWHYDTPLVFVRVGPGLMLGCVALAVPLGIGAGIVASARLLRRQTMDLLRR